MDNLEMLNALLDMTKEAEELASDVEKSERLRSMVRPAAPASQIGDEL